MSSPQPAARIGYLLCDDLMWASRITGTARALGLQVQTVRTVDQLVERCRQQPPACVILDLSMSGLVAADVAARIRAVCSTPPQLTAYGSHVDLVTLEAARSAGCDPVLPRSKMAESLEKLLQSWLA